MDSKVLFGVIAIIVVIGAIVFISSDDVATEDVAIENTKPAEPTNEPTTEAPDTETSPASAESNGASIVDVAVETEELSTLVTAVSEAGLVETLDAEGPFTVFAPANDAFADLPEGTLDGLLQPENNEDLQQVLSSHVVSGRLTASDLEDGMTVTTLSGEEYTVSVEADGTVMIGDSTVVTADVQASNGVVHIIDTVL